MKQNFTVRQGALDGVETFLCVAQHRSFRKAAAELGVTPSAISQAVRALEGVKDVNIEIVWEPYWTPEKIEPKVRAMMGF